MPDPIAEALQALAAQYREEAAAAQQAMPEVPAATPDLAETLALLGVAMQGLYADRRRS